MSLYIVYFDASDNALNRVGPFASHDAAIAAAVAKLGMPDEAVLPSEILPAIETPNSLSLVLVH